MASRGFESNPAYKPYVDNARRLAVLRNSRSSSSELQIRDLYINGVGGSVNPGKLCDLKSWQASEVNGIERSAGLATGTIGEYYARYCMPPTTGTTGSDTTGGTTTDAYDQNPPPADPSGGVEGGGMPVDPGPVPPSREEFCEGWADWVSRSSITGDEADRQNRVFQGIYTKDAQGQKSLLYTPDQTYALTKGGSAAYKNACVTDPRVNQLYDRYTKEGLWAQGGAAGKGHGTSGADFSRGFAVQYADKPGYVTNLWNHVQSEPAGAVLAATVGGVVGGYALHALGGKGVAVGATLGAFAGVNAEYAVHSTAQEISFFGWHPFD